MKQFHIGVCIAILTSALFTQDVNADKAVNNQKNNIPTNVTVNHQERLGNIIYNINKGNKKDISVNEMIADYDARITNNKANLFKIKHTTNNKDVNDIHTYLKDRQIVIENYVNELKDVMEKEKEKGRRNETKFRKLFTLMKVEEETAQVLHRTVKERSVFLETLRYQQKSPLLDKWLIRDNQMERAHLEALILASEGEDKESLEKITSLQKNQMFFNHKTVSDVTLFSQKITVEDLTKHLGFSYAYQNGFHILKDDSRTLVANESGSVEIDKKYIGNMDLFQNRWDTTLVDIDKTLQLLGYTIDWLEEDIPYIYKEVFPATPFSLLSVDELLDTMYATTLSEKKE